MYSATQNLLHNITFRHFIRLYEIGLETILAEQPKVAAFVSDAAKVVWNLFEQYNVNLELFKR